MTESKPFLWLSTYDDPPIEPGWYAVMRCWDVREGVNPDRDYWDGKEWKFGGPIGHHSPMTFPSDKEAQAWAYDNDPEW
jgi:hypothetical protein